MEYPEQEYLEVPLYRLAHSRTGDKGDISNISVIAWAPAIYPLLESQLTVPVIHDWFAYRKPARIDRYLLPALHSMNIVLDGVLDGGVNDALNLDSHGKGLSFHLLNLPVCVPREWAGLLPDIGSPPDPHRLALLR